MLQIIIWSVTRSYETDRRPPPLMRAWAGVPAREQGERQSDGQRCQGGFVHGPWFVWISPRVITGGHTQRSTDTWHRLKMNADKTQLLWLSTRQQLDKLSVTELSLLSARVTFSPAARNLGFLFDSQFARGLSTSSPWQYTNACMDWRQLTWSTTVMQFPLSPASDIFGLQTPGHYSCQGRRQHWGWGVLRSPAHASKIVCQLPFEPLSPLTFARHLKSHLFDWMTAPLRTI